MFAPLPSMLVGSGSSSDFGGSKKTSAQETGLFLTSAIATSALSIEEIIFD